MRSLSNGATPPSGVVENTKRPGVSLPPGLASINAPILAALLVISVPSAPLNSIVPIPSFTCTIVLPPTEPDLDLAKLI